jgi:hypothetical protein
MSASVRGHGEEMLQVEECHDGGRVMWGSDDDFGMSQTRDHGVGPVR